MVDTREEIKRKYRELKQQTTNNLNTHNIEKVIFSPPATIVFFKDGSKSVAKCHKDDEYSKEVGFAMAITKKMFKNYANLTEYLSQFKVLDNSIFTIKDIYKNNETFYVHCETQDLAEELLEKLYKLGFIWATGRRVAYWDTYEEDTCYTWNHSGYIKFGSRSFSEDNNQKVKQFKGF